MKIKKYTNGAWADLDKPVKRFDDYTDTATTLPLTIEVSATDAVENYQVYGAESGAGVETENLLDMADLINAPPGVLNNTDFEAVLALTLRPNTTYTLLSTGFGSSDTSDDSDIYRSVYFNGPNRAHCVFAGHPVSTISNNNGLIKIGFLKSRTNAQQYINGSAYACLLEGDHTSAQDDIVPYGYKLPLTVESGEQSGTYPLYIGDSKLGEDEYVDYETQKVYKDVSGTLTPVDPPVPFPTLTTYLGENSIDVDTTTAPDKVVLEYKGWKGIGEPQIYDNGEWKDEPSEDINLVYQLDNAYWSDGYVKDDGTIAQSSSFKYNEHFAISPSTEYVLAYETNSPDCSVSWYTENKTFIRTDEITNKRVCLYTSPSNAKYAILSVPTGSPYILFAKKSDVNSLPQITDPIDGTNWQQGWIKSDGTINTNSDYAYYDGVIDVSDCSMVFVGHSGLLVSSKYLELYEMDSNNQKTAYKDEEYIGGTYKEFNLNANTTKLRFSTSRCTDVMIIKSRVYYKT